MDKLGNARIPRARPLHQNSAWGPPDADSQSRAVSSAFGGGDNYENGDDDDGDDDVNDDDDDVEYIDDFLLGIMSNEKNRQTLVVLETMLDRFIQAQDKKALPLPPKDSYFRSILSRVAQRYGLDNQLGDEAKPGSDMKSITLIKSKAARIPKIKVSTIGSEAALKMRNDRKKDSKTSVRENDKTASVTIDDGSGSWESKVSVAPSTRIIPNVVDPIPAPVAGLTWGVAGVSQESSCNPDSESNTPNALQKKTLFLKRPGAAKSASGKDSPGLVGDGNPEYGRNVDGTFRPVTEEEYAKARARIFQPKAEESEKAEPEPPAAPSSEAAAENLSQEKPRQPLGPMDGQRGFQQRRTPGAQKPAAGSSGTASQIHEWDPSGQGSPKANPSRTNESQKDSSDYDPDFDRSRDRWQRSNPSNWNASTIAVMPFVAPQSSMAVPAFPWDSRHPGFVSPFPHMSGPFANPHPMPAVSIMSFPYPPPYSQPTGASQSTSGFPSLTVPPIPVSFHPQHPLQPIVPSTGHISFSHSSAVPHFSSHGYPGSRDFKAWQESESGTGGNDSKFRRDETGRMDSSEQPVGTSSQYNAPLDLNNESDFPALG